MDYYSILLNFRKVKVRGGAAGHIFKNASAFLPRQGGAQAPSTAHVCDPPEAFILHREIVLTMKPDFTLRAYLTTEVTSIAR
jgi:hypothetical protein